MPRRLLHGLLLGLFLLVVLDAVAARLDLAPGALPTLAGPAAWITSRAAGVTAFVALTLDVLFGLFLSTGAADRWLPRARSADVHRWLSTVTLALTAAHALPLLADRAVPFDLLALLVPFLSPYRRIAVALGVLAAHGALVVHFSFALRPRLPPKTWRKLHYLSFAVFLAALTHGLTAGSDTATLGMKLLYATSATLVTALLLARLALHYWPRLRTSLRPHP